MSHIEFKKNNEELKQYKQTFIIISAVAEMKETWYLINLNLIVMKSAASTNPTDQSTDAIFNIDHWSTLFGSNSQDNIDSL